MAETATADERKSRPGRTVYLDREQWAFVDDLAERREVSSAAIVREAVREYRERAELAASAA